MDYDFFGCKPQILTLANLCKKKEKLYWNNIIEKFTILIGKLEKMI